MLSDKTWLPTATKPSVLTNRQIQHTYGILNFTRREPCGISLCYLPLMTSSFLHIPLISPRSTLQSCIHLVPTLSSFWKSPPGSKYDMADYSVGQVAGAINIGLLFSKTTLLHFPR